VRPDRPHDRGYAIAATVVAVAAGLLTGGAVQGAAGAIAGGLLGVAAGVVLDRWLRRRGESRRRLLALPFPERWRAILQERYDHYDRLPADLRGRFEEDLRVFLAEKRVTGVGVAVSDELRLLVAASAVTLSLGWPDYEWDQLAEVLLYPQDFDRDYGFDRQELSGEAHPWGTVILSVPALEESFADPDDAYHVGIHEFAHLLDVDQTHFDGIPVGLDPARHEEWVTLAENEMQRLRRGRSVLDDYGADDPVEFLAVAVEAFFEAPLALRRRHRELYGLLADYFRQDPAGWDDARGLVL